MELPSSVAARIAFLSNYLRMGLVDLSQRCSGSYPLLGHLKTVDLSQCCSGSWLPDRKNDTAQSAGLG